MAVGADRRHIGALDGLRALAALAVVATHVGFATGFVRADLVGAVVGRLDVGVPLFFALSGFLLVRPWLAVPLGVGTSSPSLGTYAVRRLARIAPAYWIVLAVVLLISGLGWIRDQFATDLTVGPGSVVTHVVVGQGLTEHYFSNFAQTWSLTTEVVFYAVLPVVGWLLVRSTRHLGDAAARYRRVRSCCIGAVVLGIATAAYATTDLPLASPQLARSVIGHAGWFAVGIWVAAHEMTPARPDRRFSLRPGDGFALAGVCLLVAASPFGGPLTLEDSTAVQAVVREAMFTAIAALTLTAAVRGRATESPTVRFLESAPMRWLGDRSYAIFLWHIVDLFGIMTVARVDLFTGSFVVIGLATVIISIGLADLSWRLVESPVLAVAHRR
ncbi:MAG: acyltransferase, partial [Aeromicrobium sp.]